MTDALKKMFHAANTAKEKAYAPYSKFQVGACIRVLNDEYFSGCNIENAAYGLSMCAEAVAICAMVKAGHINIEEIVITSDSEDFCAPCGACRQRLWEFSANHTLVHFFNRAGEHKSEKLADLLPYPFSKKTLGAS